MKITIVGKFKKKDLEEFAKLLRKIEQRDPKEAYFMIMHENNMDLKTALELTQEIYDSVSL